MNKGDSYSTITEKKAPTDESVRLLREMEDTAFKSVIKQFRVDNNVLNGLVTYIQPNHSTADYICIYTFTLNGEKYDIKERLDYLDIQRKTKEDVIKDLYNAISKNIAEKLFNVSIEDNNLLTIFK